MSFGNIEPYDWFKRFFGGSGGSTRRGRAGEGWFGDVFSGFDEMRKDNFKNNSETFKQKHQRN